MCYLLDFEQSRRISDSGLLTVVRSAIRVWNRVEYKLCSRISYGVSAMIVRGIDHLQHLAYCAALLVALGFVVALLIPGSPGATRGHSHATADPFNSAVSGAPLQVSPDPVSLGSLSPGQQATGRITLRNPGQSPVIVERVETSCSCLDVGPFPIKIEPGRSANLTVRFDPADEPDFRGRLSIEVIGRGPTDLLAFRTRVGIEVATWSAGGKNVIDPRFFTAHN